MTKRRGNGEGSISKRSDGSWLGQVSIGNDPGTGKPKRKSFYGKTRKEVADKMAQLMQEVRNGTYVEPSTTTLGEWMGKWLTVYKKGQLRPGTYENYEVLIKTHINPGLGNTLIAKLQAQMLQNFYNEKLESGRKDGKGGLSTRTVRYFHTIIREALEQAVKEGILSRNVADSTSPPVITTKQMQLLTESELLTFLDKAKGDRLYAAYVMVAMTGLRRGELLGLCWDCVSLEQGVITVKRELLALNEGLLLQENTKTKSGKRSITLTDDSIRELKAYKKRQAQEKLLSGVAYQDNDFVFCKEDGTALNPKDFTKRFQRLLKAAGVPIVRLHDMRHLHATLLLQRSIPAKLVQERLGHRSVKMTLDLYSHVTLEMKEMAAESLNGFLSKEKSPAKTQGNQ